MVLGAGVAGLTAVDVALAQGESVLCLETFERVGGQHRSRTIGPYTFDNGTIIFYADFPLFERFPGVRAVCTPFPHTFQRVAPGGVVRAYPFESSEVFAGGPLATALNFASLARARMQRRPAANVEDFCVHAMGRRLYHSLGLRTFVERFYGLPAAQLELRFAEQRMAEISRSTRLGPMMGRLLRLLARRPAKDGYSAYREDGFARPQAGFAAMYRVVQAGLEANGAEFRCSVDLGAIRRERAGYVVACDGADIVCERVISTIPVNQALQLIGAEPEAALRSSDLLTLYVSFDGERSFEAPVLYNFDMKGSWKRLTLHSAAYGLGDGREYFSVEVPSASADAAHGEAEFAAFRAHVASSGVFRGDLRLEGCDVTHGAYPTFALGSSAARQRALARLEAFGLIACGRQGRFDYLPTTWHVMSQVDEELARARSRVRAVAEPA